MPADPSAIRVLSADQHTRLPGPPGSPFQRDEMFANEQVWVGVVTTEPGGASPWHHHGAHETYAYVLEGEASVEFGQGGAQRLTAHADGSLIVVPGGVPHREVNTGVTPNRILVMRVGGGPPVVPVAGPPT
jgi:uncharacterized RmlC-like cupin family protein